LQANVYANKKLKVHNVHNLSSLPLISFGGEKMTSAESVVSDFPCSTHVHSNSVNERRSTSHWVTLLSICVSSSLHTFNNQLSKLLMPVTLPVCYCHLRTKNNV